MNHSPGEDGRLRCRSYHRHRSPQGRGYHPARPTAARGEGGGVEDEPHAAGGTVDCDIGLAIAIEIGHWASVFLFPTTSFQGKPRWANAVVSMRRELPTTSCNITGPTVQVPVSLN